jgi:hypothetical protein
MSVAERQRRHRAMAAALDAGRAAKIDRINDGTREALSVDSPDQRSRKLEAATATWSRFLLTKGGPTLDRATVASALAKLQQICADDAAAQIRQLIRQLESW